LVRSLITLPVFGIEACIDSPIVINGFFTVFSFQKSIPRVKTYYNFPSAKHNKKEKKPEQSGKVFLLIIFIIKDLYKLKAVFLLYVAGREIDRITLFEVYALWTTC